MSSSATVLLVFGLAVGTAAVGRSQAPDGPAVPDKPKKSEKPAVDADTPLNRFCPVLPSQPSAPGKFLVYKGKRVYVCCDDCVGKFEGNPTAYVAVLPQFSVEEVAAILGDQQDARRRGGIFESLERTAREFQYAMMLSAVVLLAHLFAARAARRRVPVAAAPAEGSPPPPPPATPLAARPIAALTAVQLIFFAQLAWFQFRPAPPARRTFELGSAEGEVRIFERIHRQLLLQVQEDPAGRNRLKRTYYRGNDERSPGLFNGGNYRTCVFHLAIRSEGGKDLSPGDDVTGRRVMLHFEIERAPFTADGLFAADVIQPYVLMAGPRRPLERADNVPRPRVELTPIKPDWKWEALYPLPDPGPDVDGLSEIDAIIYLGPVGPNSPRITAAQNAHFAIGCRLPLKNGRVLPRAELWMTAVLISGSFDESNLHEWFGLRPLPEIPAAQKVTDRELGLDEHGRPIPAVPKKEKE